MKVAVCISGPFRGNFRISLDSIYQNLVEPLNADVFIETWDSYYKWPGVCGGNSILRMFGQDVFDCCPKFIRGEAAFKSNFHNTYSKLSSPIVDKVDSNILLSNYKITQLCCISENKFSSYLSPHLDQSGYWNFNQYKMFYLLYMCNNIKNLYSESTGIHYDIIIRVRPDLYFLRKPNIQSIVDLHDNQVLTMLFEVGVDDALFVATNSTMNNICNIWEYILKTKKLSPFKHLKIRSHALLMSWCLFHGIEIVNIDGCIKSSSLHGYFSLQKVLENHVPNVYKELMTDLELLKNNYQNIEGNVSTEISDWVNMIIKRMC